MWSYPQIQSAERALSGKFHRKAWSLTFCAILFMLGLMFGGGARWRFCSSRADSKNGRLQIDGRKSVGSLSQTIMWDILTGLLTRKTNRSEERRVGKEGRSRWAPYH